MSLNSQTRKSIKESSLSSWRNNDIFIGTLFLIAFSLISITIYFLPKQSILIRSFTKMTGFGDPTELPEPLDLVTKEIFSFGPLKMNLGEGTFYLDSEVDFEYDRQALQLATDGEIESKPDAQSFFQRRKAIIEDAIVTNLSGFPPENIGDPGGFEQFKFYIVDAINSALERSGNPVTNVYFHSFLIIPSNDEE